MKITNKTTVQDACLMLEVADFLEEIKKVHTPVDIPELTYGQRIDLSEAQNVKDILFLPMKILKGIEEPEVLGLPFLEVWNFSMSVFEELQRIAKRDAATFKYNPSPEEIEAGYMELNHGIFGTVDQIAQRLNIPHDEVFSLPEKRIYAMLRIDFENSMYQKRLQKVYQGNKV